MLLAVDEASIPDEFPDRAPIIVTLSVFDSRRNRFTAPFRLVADRAVLRARKRAKQPKAGSSLKQCTPEWMRPLPKPPEPTEAERAAEEKRKKQFCDELERLNAIAKERRELVGV